MSQREFLSKPELQQRKVNVAHAQLVKSRKESTQSASLPLTMDAAPPTSTPLQHPLQSQVKKPTRKSSKPIINWFQRKLVGTRARRAPEGDTLRTQRVSGTRSPNPKEKRSASVPTPPVQASQRTRHSARSQQRTPGTSVSAKHNTISLDSDYDLRSISDHTLDSDDRRRTSSVLESTWSPNSLHEADEDASVRPIPPSAPPSPAPSQSSSSYLSHPRTFASMAASTKPTTLLSVDLAGGMAHIAQAPPTPTAPAHRMNTHLRAHSAGLSSGGSITFSMLPPASPSPPLFSPHAHTSSISSRGPTHASSLQAPQHTAHHPRNNPRPSSPPLDDASVLTLASSAFALPGMRIGAHIFGRSGRTSLAEDSISHFSHPGLGDSISQFVLGDGEVDEERADEERFIYGDAGASVRALRPRSSRRGSWESEASGWSAQLTGAQISGMGSPVGNKEKGPWVGESQGTGGRSLQTENEGDAGLDSDPFSLGMVESPTDGDAPSPVQPNTETKVHPQTNTTPVGSPPETSSVLDVPTQEQQPSRAAQPAEKTVETPRVAPLSLEATPNSLIPPIQPKPTLHISSEPAPVVT